MSAGESIFERFGPNSGLIEELYKLYQTDPRLVGSSWADFFEREFKDYADTNGHAAAPLALPERIEVRDSDYAGLQERVYRMISAYRGRGHFHADINPLSKGVVKLPHVQDLDIEFYGFTDQELDLEVTCAGFQGRETMVLRDLISELKKIYCSSIGFEFTHLVSQEERSWIQDKIEKRFQNGYRLTHDQRLRRLQKIIDAEAFEAELHKKYIGHKRFSLQGAETVIPMLDTLLEEGGRNSVREAMIGMSHRGRLNVLVNTIGKPLEEVFSEFEDQNIFTVLGSGDVKYHMGFESVYRTPDGSALRVSLAPNPSHLEFVDPVVEGVARAKQDLFHKGNRHAVMPVLIHGDAAFIGQGIVPETLNLSLLSGYTTGGTIHIIVNNQIGFTTNPDESRSSVYCTDMARAVQAPIMHVNCENVEAACWAVKLAVEFRMRYGRDVVIDLYCYRKYGHNEGDDPSFTQPVTYSEIKTKKPISKIYTEKLVAEGDITEDLAKQYLNSFRERFEKAHEETAKEVIGEVCSTLGRLRVPSPETGIDRSRLEEIANTLITYPDGFTPHPKLAKILEKRVQTLKDGKGIDWGFAETLAFGSLVQEGIKVRLSGQDCGRGTFSQRHLLLSSYDGTGRYSPLTRLCPAENPTCFEVWNSPLSENAVLGFEFGYATVPEKTLILWEAQFGDFANGAQVIIDQFVAASEQKWNQLSGLVMLLPHGYEGQGPEHSSARLERYLQLCADGNMVVCYPTEAAQYFHLLRRQGLMKLKRPLIVMTPKSLLRDQRAACDVEALTSGSFQVVLETDYASDTDVEHLIFTSGKVYYDLCASLDQLDSAKVKVIRLEQIYPFPQFELKKILKSVRPLSFTWVQEEPQNMGAWSFVEPFFRNKLGVELSYVGRPPSASTATGSAKRHAAEQKEIVDTVLSIVKL
ncbi:MAG: 2-oxoglutarate dehydrogenase E1 component [Candidatus Dadabacteria bacterium]|nr:MAG: 2-oxoglutarate dehydrogenase E1 component [Candidatus Dadabacteria bacterium]